MKLSERERSFVKLGRPLITLVKDKELEAIVARIVSFYIFYIVPLHECARVVQRRCLFWVDDKKTETEH